MRFAKKDALQGLNKFVIESGVKKKLKKVILYFAAISSVFLQLGIQIASGEETLNLNFVIDKRFLVIQTVSFYAKIIDSQKQDPSKLKKHHIKRATKLTADNSNEDVLADFIVYAKKVSKSKFEILRGSYSIGALAKRWNFWTPEDLSDRKLDVYYRGLS